jgi:uncharacterized protein with PhoU and TrkA domain
MKKLLVISSLTFVATAFAAEKPVKVQLFQDSVINGKTFKAGEYKISVTNGTAVIRQGKTAIEVPAREETDPNKISSTELLYKNGSELQQIRLGGGHTVIDFEPAGPNHSGM